MRQVLVQKDRGFIQVLCNLADSRLNDHLFFLPWKKSSHTQQAQDKSQCPELLLYFKEESFGAHRQLLSVLSPHPGSLFPAAVHFRLPPCQGHMVT